MHTHHRDYVYVYLYTIFYVYDKEERKNYQCKQLYTVFSFSI